MPAKLQPLNLRITGSANGLSAALGKAQGDVGSFSVYTERQASKISHALSSIAAFALPAGLTAGLGFGVQLAADAQDAELSFKALTGSAEAAKNVIAELNSFSASTPFSFADDVLPAAQQLLTYGFSVDELQDQLRILGNVAAVSGTDFAELAKLIGRARSTNLIFTEDLNQLSDRAIPVLDLLAERFGVTTAEVRKLASQGKIEFADLAAVLEYLGGEGGKFGDALQERSVALNGAISKLKDNVKLLATDIGSFLVPATTEAVQWATEWVQYIRELDPATVELAAKTTAFTVALGGTALVLPKLIALGKELALAIRAIASASTIAQALSGPKGWASVAAGLAIAGGSVYAVDQLFDSFNQTQSQSVAIGGEVADSIGETAKRSIEAGDSAKSAAAEHEKWLKTADGLRSQLETPVEKYERKIRELSMAVREGGLEWEFFERGVASALRELDSANSSTEFARPDALLKGSEAAEELVYRFQQQAAGDDDFQARLDKQVADTKREIAALDKQAANEAERRKTEIAQSALALAEANVDQLTTSFEAAKNEFRELAAEAAKLSDLSYDRDGLIAGTNALGSQFRSLITGQFDGIALDREKASAFDAAQAKADAKLAEVLQKEEQLNRAQAQAEAARQAAADTQMQDQLEQNNALLATVRDAIRADREPMPLDL
ncbi:MAG TPA: hypothetical protein DDW52_24100 [Planctomycetaceae bacterium]|nr:hypothetical protein [Planctomycetaceae bacterium]